MEAFLLIVLMVGILVVTVIITAVWCVSAAVRGIFGLFRPSQRPYHQPPQIMSQVCTNRSCQAGNPAHARFCRRCGKSLPSLLRVVNDQAA